MSVPQAYYLDESERQLALLAIANLALVRPGFDYALGEIADHLAGRELFETMKRLNVDQLHPRPWPTLIEKDQQQ